MEDAPQKLDKTRPYGVIVGDPNLAFEQDGFHFGPGGALVEAWTTAAALANEKVVRAKQAAKEARVAAQQAKQERARILKDEH